MNKMLLRSNAYIRNSYARLLLYYYKLGLGKKSEITGAIITKDLINTIETRYKQLGGNPITLKLREYTPSKNGQSNQYED